MRSLLRNLPLASGALTLSFLLVGCDAGTTTTPPAPATTAPAPAPEPTKGAMEGPAPKGGAMEGPAPKAEMETPKADPAPPAAEKPKEDMPK